MITLFNKKLLFFEHKNENNCFLLFSEIKYEIESRFLTELFYHITILKNLQLKLQKRTILVQYFTYYNYDM